MATCICSSREHVTQESEWLYDCRVHSATTASSVGSARSVCSVMADALASLRCRLLRTLALGSNHAVDALAHGSRAVLRVRHTLQPQHVGHLGLREPDGDELGAWVIGGGPTHRVRRLSAQSGRCAVYRNTPCRGYRARPRQPPYTARVMRRA